MPITATCAACGTSFRVPDEHAGKRAKCKQCGEVLEIPEMESSDDEGATAEPEGAPRRSREGSERSRRRRAKEPEPDALPPVAIAVAVVAGLAGAALWALIGIKTGRSFGYGAAGIGMLVGFAAAKLGGRGKVAGGVAAAIAAMSIVGGTFAIYASLHGDVIDAAMGDAGLRSDIREEFEFERDLGRWSKGLDDAPTAAGLREFLDVDTEEEGGPPAGDVRELLDLLPEFEKLDAEGSYQRYRAEARKRIEAEVTTMTILKEGLGPVDILFLVIGIGAAFSFVAGSSRR